MILYTTESIKYAPYAAVIGYPSNKRHKLDFWKITYTVHGESEVIINGETKPLRNNTILFVQPRTVLQNTNFAPHHEYRHRDIYISDEKLRKICASLPVNPYEQLLDGTVYFNVSRLQTENLEYILNLFPLHSEEKNAYLDTLHQTVVINCLMMFIQSTVFTPKPPAWLVKIADRATYDEYLQHDASYFLQDIHYSIRHVGRMFKKYYGMSPTAYLTKAKIIQASNLLMNQELLVVDIAQRLGFATQSGFIKAFKAYFHLSPSAWRKKYLFDKNSASTMKSGGTKIIEE